MRTFLEKGYGWPLFVITLLVSSVVMMGIVVMAARSDGGAQVVDDYYEQAVKWDSLAEARTAASTLGWTTSLTLGRSEATIDGIIVLKDSSGAAVTDYAVHVSLRRPQLAAEVANVSALPASEPGMYAFSAPHDDLGLWDIQAYLTPISGTGTPLQIDWRREVR